jgi:hypothetical protein
VAIVLFITLLGIIIYKYKHWSIVKIG